jgi:hypothetical protein
LIKVWGQQNNQYFSPDTEPIIRRACTVNKITPVSFSESETRDTDYLDTHSIQRMLSDTRIRRIPQVWCVAILGVITALPATVVINWLPYSEVTIGGGVMLFGATIAGAIAANRSVDPSAAGLRTGFLGGMIAVSVFILTEGMAVPWSIKTIVFFLVAVVMLLSVSPVFGLISGRIGGRVANTVGDSRIKQAS